MKKIYMLMAMLVASVGLFADNYVKVTEAPTDWSGTYLLVYESASANYAFSGIDAASNNVSVTIADNTIAALPDGAAELEIAAMDGGYSLKVVGGANDGKYMHGKAKTASTGKLNNGMLFADAPAANAISMTDGVLTIQSVAEETTLQFNSAATSLWFRYFGSVQKPVQLYKKQAGGDTPEPPAPAFSWDNYAFLGNGSGDAANENRFKTNVADNAGCAVVNIQNAPWATEGAGIYMTFPSADQIAVVGDVAYVIQGSGIIFYLSSFLYAQETEITVTWNGGSAAFKVYNANVETPVIPDPNPVDPVEGAYVKVTEAPTDWSGTYLLVYESADGNKAFSGTDVANEAVAVTIANNTIAALPAGAAELEIATMDGGYSVQVKGNANDGKYMHGSSASNTISFINAADANTFTLEADGVKMESQTSIMRYNTADGQCRFRYFKSTSYTNQQPVQLYKKGAAEPEPQPTIEAITLESAHTMAKGESYQLIPGLVPAGVTTSVPFTYSSSAEAIATVNENGVVTALGVGEAVITVSLAVSEPALTATCNLTVTPAAPMAGDYVVGGDNAAYASLHDALADVNERGLGADVRLLIGADLTEGTNVGVQNPSDYNLEITVKDANDYTVTFTQTTDNAGPSGNLCIGCDMTLNHTCASVLTHNVTINGYYQNDGIRHLTLASAATCHKLNGPILIYGNVKNSSVIGTNLVVNQAQGSSIYCVTIRGQKNTVFVPENILIQDCLLDNKLGSAAQGIYTQMSGTGICKNISIVNNDFDVRTRGFFMGANSGLTLIKGNTFKVHQSAAGMTSYAIWGYQHISDSVVIANNKFLELATAATTTSTGIFGIQTGVGGVWIIENNMMTGFKALSATATDVKMIGIAVSAATEAQIHHNTIVMNDDAAVPAAATAVALVDLANVNDFRNNLLVSKAQTGAIRIFKNVISNPTAYNVYELGATTVFDDAHATLADYQALEINAKEAVVAFADLAAGDLTLTGEIDQNLAVPNMDIDMYVESDILGQLRHSPNACAGAHEAADLNITPEPTALQNTTISGVWYANGMLYNEQNLFLQVYAANGMLVASGYDNINMSSYAAGVYVVRTATSAMRIIK